MSELDPRQSLDAVRRRALERLADLTDDYAGIVEASRYSNADDEHDPEGATIAFERSQVGSLVEHARAQLVEVDAALVRLKSGLYGTCERCGGPIALGRLEARPTARLCIDCAASDRSA
jgi:RNA polymerase-binding protein DksA